MNTSSRSTRAAYEEWFRLGAKFFHETNLRRKGLALAAIVAGIALMAL